jgi:hypothetical protein
MTLVALLRKWLVATPLTDKRALIVAVVALGLPTIMRASLDGIVVGSGLVPYFPFVLLAAILLEWEAAAIVMLISAVIGDWLFIGPHHRLLEEPTDIFGVVMFLAGSSLIIALVHAIRTALHDLVGPTSNNGVIFSLKEDQAWASWPTAGFHLRLGPQEEVARMMADFLAQLELANRLRTAAQEKALQSAS